MPHPGFAPLGSCTYQDTSQEREVGIPDPAVQPWPRPGGAQSPLKDEGQMRQGAGLVSLSPQGQQEVEPCTRPWCGELPSNYTPGTQLRCARGGPGTAPGTVVSALRGDSELHPERQTAESAVDPRQDRGPL